MINIWPLSKKKKLWLIKLKRKKKLRMLKKKHCLRNFLSKKRGEERNKRNSQPSKMSFIWPNSKKMRRERPLRKKRKDKKLENNFKRLTELLRNSKQNRDKKSVKWKL